MPAVAGHGVRCRARVKREQTGAVLPARYVELLAPRVETEFHSMPAMNPTHVVIEFGRLVHKTGVFRAYRKVVCSRPADSGEREVRDVRQAERARLILSHARGVNVARIGTPRKAIIEVVQQVWFEDVVVAESDISSSRAALVGIDRTQAAVRGTALRSARDAARIFLLVRPVDVTLDGIEMRVDRAPRDVLQIVHQRVGPFREQRDDFLGYPADPRVRNHVAGEWLACAALTCQRVVDDSGRQQRR